jgi:hypothetical protein
MQFANARKLDRKSGVHLGERGAPVDCLRVWYGRRGGNVKVVEFDYRERWFRRYSRQGIPDPIQAGRDQPVFLRFVPQIGNKGRAQDVSGKDILEL